MKLPTYMLNPHILNSVEAINNALLALDACTSEQNLEQTLTSLLGVERVKALELFLSGSRLPVDEWIISSFPISSHAFQTSLAKKILPRISDFLYFQQLPIDTKTQATLRTINARSMIASAPGVLDALSSMSFADREVEESGPGTRGTKSFKVKQSQRKQKVKRRASTTTAPINSKAFDNMNLQVPSSSQEADELASRLLKEQKQVLKTYLEILRMPVLVDAIKASSIFCTDMHMDDAPSNPNITNTDFSNSTRNIDAKQSETLAPPSYPTIQPMKSAFHFEDVKGFGDWQILISARADRDLRDARTRDVTLFEIIVKKIKELSKGHFSDDNQKILSGTAAGVPIYEAKMTRDTRLVYQVDCIQNYDSDSERQVLRIFGIYTHAQLNRGFWNSMSRQLAKKGKEYRERCIYRNAPGAPGNALISPATFPIKEDEQALSPSDVLELPKEDLDEMHSLLILGKFVTFSQPILNSILADLDVTFPFHVSLRERKIIEHPSSCYVLGRSGTGKTTTMLFKMIGIERTFELLPNIGNRPRQMFVTQSRVLASKVEEYFLKLSLSISTASQSLRQLRSQIKVREEAGGEGLLGEEDNTKWSPDLPKCFSQLGDEHFPLFITFAQLCEMLQEDFLRMQLSSEGIDPASSSSSNGEPTPVISRKYLSYQDFLSKYWARFPQPLTKGLDPALVFSEFMGVIKGSEKALKTPTQYLDQSTYENLGHRAFSTFSGQRTTIYSLFQSYMRGKRLHGGYDSADRTHTILSALRKYGVPGRRKVDYIYVDEVQDNLLIDSLVLRSICGNPDGMFWAGDTAQTISVGSSFRFNELKAFLYRVEENRIRSAQKSNITLVRPKQPQVFQLTVNYRSHAGIVNCAHSIIQLIEAFWPDSIDSLCPEQGVIDGSKPVFFRGWDEDTVRYEQFLFGNAGNPIEFGAQQCILVRDETALANLRKQVGEIGVIMTLYESKGLEFNDVLLYNFFEDSTVDYSKWRVVLNAINGQPAPDLEARHVSVCSELKCLYVAITRARKNVWIADRSEKGEPMRLLWTRTGQIQNCSPETGVPNLADSSSTLEEWAKQGRNLFDHKRYLQAKYCYQRANMPRESTVANAYFLREEARKLPIGRSNKADHLAQDAWWDAAQEFLSCARDPPSLKNRAAYFRIAGECFEQGNDEIEAAQAYLQAGEYTKSCKLYRQNGRFDEAVEIIETHRLEVMPDFADNILNVARLYYLTTHDLECVLAVRPCKHIQRRPCEFFGKVNNLFVSTDEELEFLEDRDLNLARAIYLSTLPGRAVEAAKLYISEGRLLKAIKLYLKDPTNEEAMREGYKSILRGLWDHISFGVSLDTTKDIVDKLLDLASGLNPSLLEPADYDEIVMFKELKAAASSTIYTYASKLESLGAAFYRSRRLPAALLCLDSCFSKTLHIQDLKAHELANTLCHFNFYLNLMWQVAFKVDPCRTASVQRLFSFQASAENLFSLRSGSFLYSAYQDYGVEGDKTDDDTLVSDAQLIRVLRSALKRRLHDRILEENNKCYRAQAFRSCLTFAIFGQCRRTECPDEHRPGSAFDVNSYNDRIRIHLQQILIIRTLNVLEYTRSWQRYWMDRLYEALNPEYHHHGSVLNLDVQHIPEAPRGLSVVKDWVRAQVYALHHSPQKDVLITALMRGADMAFTFDRHQAATYVYRARCMMVPIDSPDYFRANAYVLGEFIQSLHATDVWSISGGVLFVEHIVQRQLPVNVNTLCNFLEFLCTSLVVHTKYHRFGVLHDMTLPRSWLLKLVRADRLVEPKDTRTLLRFADIVCMLLGPVSTGNNADFLLCAGRSLATLTDMHRQVFTTRICRVLCLFGLNVPGYALKQQILHAIIALRTEHRRLYTTYAAAEEWPQLARTVRFEQGKSRFDEMVQILHADRDISQFPYPGVRRIIHRHLEELMTMLSPAHTPENTQVDPSISGTTGSTLSAAPTFTTLQRSPKPVVISPVELAVEDPPDTAALGNIVAIKQATQTLPPAVPSSDVDVHSDAVSFHVPTDVDEVLLEQESDSDDEDAGLEISTTEVPLTMPEAWVAVKHTVDEERAASTIQSAYRKWLIRRRAASTDSQTILRFWKLYLDISAELQLPTSYRVTILGPLPYILSCLDGMHTYTHALKNKTKKRMNNAKHQELEDINTRLTLTNGTIKKITQLQDELGPKSPIHQQGNLLVLRASVQIVDNLIRGFSMPVPPEVIADLDLGVKGILQVPQPRKPKVSEKKPDLVLDDDLYEV